MKFIQMTYDTGAHIPHLALSIAKLAEEANLSMFMQNGVIVLTKSKMTAMELINTIEEIEKVSIDLSIHLAEACGTCTDCAECPCEDLGDPIIELPEYLLEEAGIPCNAKLVASVNEEENTVTVHQADHEHDLRDVPDWILDMMDGNNVCVGKLEEHLITDRVIYGE